MGQLWTDTVATISRLCSKCCPPFECTEPRGAVKYWCVRFMRFVWPAVWLLYHTRIRTVKLRVLIFFIQRAQQLFTVMHFVILCISCTLHINHDKRATCNNYGNNASSSSLSPLLCHAAAVRNKLLQILCIEICVNFFNDPIVKIKLIKMRRRRKRRSTSSHIQLWWRLEIICSRSTCGGNNINFKFVGKYVWFGCYSLPANVEKFLRLSDKDIHEILFSLSPSPTMSTEVSQKTHNRQVVWWWDAKYLHALPHYMKKGSF